jgi:dTDP-4-dehydrorhamnose 3,5-epimerase
MDIVATSLAGVWKLALAPVRDERGSFVRTFDGAAFAAHGLVTAWAEHGEAVNARAGTVRGLHFQREPHAEAKLVRCTRGAIFDVLLDVRPGSPTYGRWEAFHLTEREDTAIYAAAGLAHGYQTLRDDTIVQYLLDTPYVAAAATGYRHDSPALAIRWPLETTAISVRDRALALFTP